MLPRGTQKAKRPLCSAQRSAWGPQTFRSSLSAHPLRRHAPNASKTACFPNATGIDIGLHGLAAPRVGSLVGRTREIETMTLRKLISVASLLAALSIAGCGDDEVCHNCEVGELREDCRDFLRDCDGSDCEDQALLECAES